MSSWSARLRTCLTLLLFYSLCMACADVEGTSGDRTAVTTDSPVPTAGSGGTGSTNTNTGGGNLRAQGTAGQAASLNGVSLRWRYDLRRCLARTSVTPTQGDPVVMANCASDVRQAFYSNASTFHVDGNFCLCASPNGGGLYIDQCHDDNILLYLSVSGDVTKSLGVGPQGYIVPSDSGGTVGKPINLVSSPPTTAAQGIWDMVGVGNVGGTLISLPDTPPVFCLARDGSGVTIAGCDKSQAAQRWRIDAGFLVNDTGACMTCDVGAGTCGFQSCASANGSLPNDQRWRSHLFLQYIGNGNATWLVADRTTRAVTLGSSFISWSFGAQTQ